jgi:hypothetical protein
LKNALTPRESLAREVSREKQHEQRFVEDMLKVFNEDKADQPAELCDLLNYDVLLRTNKIIKRVLMPAPKFKDDFFFTHLYQEKEESPAKGKRKKKAPKPEEKAVAFNYKVDVPFINTNEDRQIKKLQQHPVLSIVGKRIGQQGQTEFMCTFDIKIRRSWMLQHLLVKEYTDMMLQYELVIRNKQMMRRVCDNVPKIKDCLSYCLLSHRISSAPHKEMPKIIYLKQQIQLTEIVVDNKDEVKDIE